MPLIMAHDSGARPADAGYVQSTWLRKQPDFHIAKVHERERGYGIYFNQCMCPCTAHSVTLS